MNNLYFTKTVFLFQPQLSHQPINHFLHFPPANFGLTSEVSSKLTPALTGYRDTTHKLTQRQESALLSDFSRTLNHAGRRARGFCRCPALSQVRAHTPNQHLSSKATKLGTHTHEVNTNQEQQLNVRKSERR